MRQRVHHQGEARQTLLEAFPAWRRNGVFGGSAALALAELGALADAARVGTAAIEAICLRAVHAGGQRDALVS